MNKEVNDNLNEIASIRKKLEKLDQEIRDLEHKQTKYLFVLNEVNSRLAKLDINKRYTGDNASAIRKELSAIKNMENRVETKKDNIAVLETVYNNLSEQIRVYENAKQDSKQLKKNSENQKLLLEKLNDLIEENGQYGPMSRLWTQKVELFSPYLIARRDVSYAARASSSTCCGVL